MIDLPKCPVCGTGLRMMITGPTIERDGIFVGDHILRRVEFKCGAAARERRDINDRKLITWVWALGCPNAMDSCDQT